MRNILVTGATGFVGSYLVKLLIDETPDVIFCLSRMPVKSNNPRCVFIKRDLTADLDLDIEVDVIFNCAGVISDEKNMFAVNVLGVGKLIEFAIKKKAVLIHLSSAGIYGPQVNKRVIEESSCTPESLYERTKLEAERLIFSAVKSQGLKASMIRPTTVIGVGRSPEKDSFLHLCKAIKNGRYRNINCGSGIYGIIHVHEVSRSLIHLANYGLHNGDAYNLNTEITFRDFANLVTKKFNLHAPPNLSKPIAYSISIMLYLLSFVLNKKNPLTFSRIRALTNKTIYPSDKIKKELGYKPERKIEQYILETVSSYTQMNLL